MPRIKTFANRVIFQPLHLIRLVPNSLAFILLIFFRKGYSLSHLRYFKEYSAGPIQKDEALFLYALVKTVDPQTIVEFGFLVGDSAINFIKAMSPDAKLYSYDISNTSMQHAKRIYDKRFKFILKSQTDFESLDIDNRLVDLVFFDASHDFNLNVAAFERLRGSLSERALIVVHDTGAWYGDLKGFKTPEGFFLGGSTCGGYVHRPDERRFVNHIKANMKDFDQIHIHSTSKFRHGLTILQKNAGPLPL